MYKFIGFIIILGYTIIGSSQAPAAISTTVAKRSDDNTVTFYAKDSVLITADTYFINEANAAVLLCHQAGFSRGEYVKTAKKLNELGFSCMAIDQRSGKEVNGIINRTAIDANNKFMNVGFAGAKRDVEAAIDYLFAINGERPIILVGSSYSASLALWIAGERNKKVKAVAAFSPGEYLKGKDVAKLIKPLRIPVFVTSSKREIVPVEKLLRRTKRTYITHYKPKEKGIHGSRAIWETTDGYEGYWKAFKEFLLEQI
ncbi:MAG: alpha/beta hydrolase [Flavobacteriaceae bacterium]|nr:alpha/beta hydrolase [Flavobacteriaceae bacterium]